MAHSYCGKLGQPVLMQCQIHIDCVGAHILGGLSTAQCSRLPGVATKAYHGAAVRSDALPWSRLLAARQLPKAEA